MAIRPPGAPQRTRQPRIRPRRRSEFRAELDAPAVKRPASNEIAMFLPEIVMGKLIPAVAASGKPNMNSAERRAVSASYCRPQSDGQRTTGSPWKRRLEGGDTPKPTSIIRRGRWVGTVPM